MNRFRGAWRRLLRCAYVLPGLATVAHVFLADAGVMQRHAGGQLLRQCLRILHSETAPPFCSDHGLQRQSEADRRSARFCPSLCLTGLRK